MNLGPPLRRGAAHAVSHRLSSRSINQLSQVLRPASRFKPAAQHIQSIHPSNRSILIDTCQCNRSVSPIKQRRSISPINQSSASLSLTQSISISSPIHRLTSQSVDQSIDPSRHQTIHYCLRHVTNVVSSRRLACNQSIDQSVQSITISAMRSTTEIVHIVQSY